MKPKTTRKTKTLSNKPQKQIEFLKLTTLNENWDNYLKKAIDQKISYSKFLINILNEEYNFRTERARVARMDRANVPEKFVMSTFPFEKQPTLKRKVVMEMLESRRYIENSEYLVFIGPTGCGKTGLATSFLYDAVNAGYKGLFISFQNMIRKLLEAVATHTEKKVLKYFLTWDVLLIDEFGYSVLDKEVSGLFFEIIKERHGRKTNLITTQLGFSEWQRFIPDTHMCSAILSRATEKCFLFDMTKCVSLRPRGITYATVNK
jgi:DNA replication protein DnaC